MDELSFMIQVADRYGGRLVNYFLSIETLHKNERRQQCNLQFWRVELGPSIRGSDPAEPSYSVDRGKDLKTHLGLKNRRYNQGV